MSLPGIFGSTKPVKVPHRLKKFDADDYNDAEFTKIDLKIPNQENNNWCWAAVSGGVADYFGLAVESQCRFVARALKETSESCCKDGRGGDCDQQWYLHKALALYDCYDRYEKGAASATKVDRELEERRPLCVRVQWTEGGGGGISWPFRVC